MSGKRLCHSTNLCYIGEAPTKLFDWIVSLVNQTLSGLIDLQCVRPRVAYRTDRDQLFFNASCFGDMLGTAVVASRHHY
jgi:hypothetical protein